MFGTIRKHQTWLWSLIIGFVIVSFVIFFQPGVGPTGGGGARGGDLDVSIFGEPVSQAEFNRMARTAQLSYFLRGQSAPGETELVQEVLIQIMIARQYEDFGIDVGPEAAAAWMRERLLGGGSTFGGLTLSEFVDQRLKPSFKLEDLQELVRHEAARELVRGIVTAPGHLVPPVEAEAMFLERNKRITAEVAYVAETNYVDQVVLNPNELTKFYSNRVASYRVPEQLVVDYVYFNPSNYLDEAKVAAGEDEMAAEVESVLTAQRRANEFVSLYYDQEPLDPEGMRKAADAQSLEVVTSEPFSRQSPPEGVKAANSFAAQAFELSEEAPFSLPIEGSEGFYALAFKERLPSRPRPYEEVAEKVADDYRRAEARRLARTAADDFYGLVTNEVSAAQSFVQMAELAGFSTGTMTNISLSDPTSATLDLPVSAPYAASVAGGLEVGGVSPPRSTTDGLMMVKLLDERDPTAEEMNAEIGEVREQIASSRTAEIFQEWLGAQLQASGLSEYFERQMRQREAANAPTNPPPVAP